MPKSTSEFKVGVFVIIGLALLAAMIIFVGDTNLFEKGYNLKVVFNYTGGLDEGAPVRVAGVEVGRVLKVDLEDTTKVKLELWIKQGVNIHQDAEVSISTMGLLGEKYIEIDPGTLKVPLVKDGGSLEGEDPVRFERALKMGEEMVKKLDGIADCLNSIIVETNAKESIKEILKNAQEASQQMNVLLTQLNGMVQENHQEVKVTIANFKDISVLLKKESDKFSDSLTSLKNVLGKVEKGEGTIGKLVNSEEIYNQLDVFIEDIQQNPWKLFRKPKRTPKKKMKNDAGK